MKKSLQLSLFLLFIIIFSLSAKVDIAKADIVNPYQIYTYKQMEADIYKLQREYPDLIKVKSIGKSEYGRELYAVSVGKGTATIFINGSHHAREWMSTTLNMNMIEQYAKAFRNKQLINGYGAKRILNECTIWFVPMVNPDGVTLQQYGLSAFPKDLHTSLIKMNQGSTDFKRWKANGKGVDLNRQYNGDWTGVYSPSSPSYANYKGTSPHSAAEIKAILNFTYEIDPEIAVAYHTSGKVLYWYYKQTGSDYSRDYEYAKELGKMTGYSLIKPVPNVRGGGYTDWFIQALKRPGFTPELSRYYHETHVSITEFPTIWKENQVVGLYLANEGYKLYQKRLPQIASKIRKELLAVDQKGRELRNYYSDNISNEKDIKIDQNLIQLSKRYQSDLNTMKNKIKTLPSTYQQQFTSKMDRLQLFQTNTENFIASINAGEALKNKTNYFDSAFSRGLMTPKLISAYELYQKQQKTTLSVIDKMYSGKVRNLAKQKYISPANLLIENNKYELSRYALTNKLEKELKEGKIDLAKQDLINLEKLEADSKLFKEVGNKITPGKYKTYKLLEKKLLDQKQKIIDWLKKLEEQEKEEEKNIPTPKNSESGNSSTTTAADLDSEKLKTPNKTIELNEQNQQTSELP